MDHFNIDPAVEEKLREESTYPHWRVHFNPREGMRSVEVWSRRAYEKYWGDGFVTAIAYETKEQAEAALPGLALRPYDRDISDLPQPLLDRHVPLIHHEHPSWYYITAVCVSPPQSDESVFHHEYAMPTDEELAMIASYHDEYVQRYYGNPEYGWIARQREKHPFDIDGGANGRYLMKYPANEERGYTGGWARKHMTWEHGPRPARFDEKQMTLLEVLDTDRTIGDEPMPEWVAWKAAHPEIFGAKNDG
jgi:hypothetical protein